MSNENGNAALIERPSSAQLDRSINDVNPMSLLQLAVNQGAQIDTIERLAKLQREMQAHQDMVDFNEALNRCQKRLTRIAADMVNPQTRSRYASYAQLDRAVRPIYTDEGISISFGEADPPCADMIRVICHVSRGGYSRIYQKDMPIVTTGAQGKAVMTATHAHGSAGSYGKRYLLMDIFNLAIGEDDQDGNGANSGMPVEDFIKAREAIEAAPNEEALKAIYLPAVKEADEKYHDKQAVASLADAKNKRWREIKGTVGGAR